MTVTATETTTAPAPRGRVRIAIVSPDILARIRQEFASKGLSVSIDRLPALELTVEPGPGAPPAAAALADVLSRLAGPAAHKGPAASAHYQLTLVAEPARPEPAPSRSDHPRHPPTAPDHRRPPRPRAHNLSPREAEVMTCISRGMPNAAIAERMALSQKTVKNHVNHIFAKLGARSRVEAVLMWQGRETAAA
ncbi:DNA-binding CsgD family transcriptional regulator [Catenulispora sp. GP43]|uniref:helix-turn-helix transcriptional regulator n=1 Tax=Catenulispora sp. GP43 TaxID=3156263 RepID=UPI0035165CAA